MIKLLPLQLLLVVFVGVLSLTPGIALGSVLSSTEFQAIAQEPVTNVKAMDPQKDTAIQAPEDVSFQCAADFLPCMDFENVTDPSAIGLAGKTVYVTAGSKGGTRFPNIFDSSNPASLDTDLGTPNSDFGGNGIGIGGNAGSAHPNFIPQDNIIVVQDPKYDYPNDVAEFGTFIEFDFSEFGGVDLGYLALVDIEEDQHTSVQGFDIDGNIIKEIPLIETGDNGATTLTLEGFDNVYRLRIVLNGSGAIASICFENSEFYSGEPEVAIDEEDLAGVYFSDQKIYGDCGLSQIIRTWVAVENNGTTHSDVQTITFADTTAPVFNETLPENLELCCETIPDPVVLTATDNCDSEVEVVYTEEITWSEECEWNRVIERTWTATDCAGNETVHHQTVNVFDTMKPKFRGQLPEDITVSCNAIPEAPQLVAEDLCSETVTITLEETMIDIDEACPNNYTLVRTWSATDCSGNTKTHTQHIYVKDEQAPEFDVLPETTLNASCGNIPEPAVLTATDNCDLQTIEVTFDEKINTSGSECPGTYTIIRTWSASDCSGNEAVFTQTINVIDDTAPEFVETLPQDITVNCSEVPEAIELTATDGCDSTPEVTFEETEGTFSDCSAGKTLVRTWTAKDCSGNTVSHTQTITIIDNVPPVLISETPADADVFCSEVPSIPSLEFSDDCNGNVEVAFEEISNYTTSDADYEITRTWTATDVCGNETIVTQNIFVVNDPEKITAAPVSICIEDQAIDLIAQAGMDLGSNGTWEMNGNPVTLENGYMDPFDYNVGEYIFTYRSTEGDCGTIVTFSVNIHDECVVLPCSSASDISISKAVTPNGDSYNEYFTVKGVNQDCGFTLKVRIYNRWGTLVYSSDDYRNDWNGLTTNGSVGSADRVPAGTYYYVVTLLNSGIDPITGYLLMGTGSN
ncbi:gliding motility-associated C-terminal domain-containing protein [Robertkochia solimangrovi]|uniref:gliding motility-associated C-terminal domain-containing protein n=1 Tax=Robertkochia solimangrovi TaxID=2213046 RepID=UPI001180443B|nr:gliding motility-associated C-terminal domain-containing protein [Robertkochia solimangrovi]TRZ42882.1 hypothetical protein DMZ48_12505 [Robertkochia solimangrovi]